MGGPSKISDLMHI